MNAYITYTEVQTAVTQKLLAGNQERTRLNPRKRNVLREIALSLLSFIF